jgi:hypothetical protein
MKSSSIGRALGLSSSAAFGVCLSTLVLCRATPAHAQIENTSHGLFTLFSIETGSYNTAIGYAALHLNTVGSENSGLGTWSLFNTTTGGRNTAVGYHANSKNTTGSNNTAVGWRAISTSDSGNRNSAVGNGALLSNLGSDNTAVGTYAVRENTTGSYNVAVGFRALGTNTTGSGNVAVGDHALDPVLGHTGSYNTEIGWGGCCPPAYDFTNAHTFGFLARPTADNSVRIGNTNVISIGGNAPWSSPSDARFKREVREDIPGTSFISKLRPVTFRWDLERLNKFMGAESDAPRNEEKAHRRYTGFLAQEVEEAARQAEFDFSAIIKPESKKSHYDLAYAEFVVPLIKATQERQMQINELQGIVQRLADGGKLSDSELATYAPWAMGVGGGNPRSPWPAALVPIVASIMLLFLFGFSWRKGLLRLPRSLQIPYRRAATAGVSILASTGLFIFSTDARAQENTKLGEYALNYVTTGIRNTAIGSRALRDTTTASENTALGRGALYRNTTGYPNTAVGAGALYYCAECMDNTAVGKDALMSNTSGYQNTAIGDEAMLSNVSGDYNTALGVNAMRSATDSNNNVAVGHSALWQLTTGAGNVGVGYSAGGTLTTGTNNTAVGHGAMYGTFGSVSNSGGFGWLAIPTASNTYRIGNSSVTSIGGAVQWSNLSDARFKKDVQADVPGLSFIMKLRPVTFKWDLKKLNAFTGLEEAMQNDVLRAAQEEKERKRYTGFLAQEVDKAANQAGFDFSGVVKPANDRSHYDLAYAEFVVPLVKAAQEQQQQLDQLRERMGRLAAAGGADNRLSFASVLMSLSDLGKNHGGKIFGLVLVAGLLTFFARRRGAGPKGALTPQSAS